MDTWKQSLFEYFMIISIILEVTSPLKTMFMVESYVHGKLNNTFILHPIRHSSASAFGLPRTYSLDRPYSCFFSSALITDPANGTSTHFAPPFAGGKKRPHQYKKMEHKNLISKDKTIALLRTETLQVQSKEREPDKRNNHGPLMLNENIYFIINKYRAHIPYNITTLKVPILRWIENGCTNHPLLRRSSEIWSTLIMF